jgi:hypothetical protein
VILACRNRTKAEAAADAITQSQPDARVDFADLDLASLDSIRRFADKLAGRIEGAQAQHELEMRAGPAQRDVELSRWRAAAVGRCAVGAGEHVGLGVAAVAGVQRGKPRGKVS